MKKTNSGSLYAWLEARPLTIGRLLDYADGVPHQQIAAMLLSIGPSLQNDYETGQRRNSRLRRLIIFGRLIERLAFEVEGIPKRRAHRL